MTHAEDTPGAEPIAIVGIAARVPGASDTAQFWRNLVDGVESVTRFTRDEQISRGAKASDVDDPSWVAASPVVTGFDEFDAGLFGMSAREAQVASPHHRLFLESCFTALQDAGYDPARYDGPIGVYAGTGGNEYLWENVLRNAAIGASPYNQVSLATGNSPNYVATLPAYKLDLRGPSLTVHTACSTSLVAFHLACEALRNHECDMALAGGVNIELPHGIGYLGMDGFTSPDGHCRPFDAGANGTVWGSGVGVALIKRLSDAIADGDTIRAVVLGNAINNDGAGKVGFTAPSQDGQAEAIAQAVGMAGVDPRTVTYVEAHGTGTAVGDPIELAALAAVYGDGAADRGWCGIGSVKSNIGHLSQAAGIISLIKVVLAMEHGLIPPTVNYERPNPAVDFAETPFWVADSLTRWETGGLPRRAGVSSFGIGGTNAHVLLEQAPAPKPAPAEGPQVLQVSARTASALDKAVAQLAEHLADSDAALADVALTLREGRTAYPHRVAVVAEDVADAAAALRAKRRRISGVAGEPRIAFLFSGQGSQYAGMAKDLYEREPVFAAAADECTAVLGDELRGLLLDTEGGELIGQTQHTQPALFTVEYALAKLWESVGVRPAAMLGHSIGEYAAATVAGVFSLPDALRVVAERGRLMQSLPAGSMLAVQQDESEVELPDGLSVATVNGPGTCVVAGETVAVEAFAAALADKGVKAKALRTSHAFHSAMMDPILDEFTALLNTVVLHAPTVPVLSNVTGDWLTAEQATDPRYWAAHLRRPVRFGAGVATLLSADGPWQLVEIGPGRQLAGLARMQIARADEAQRGLAPLTSLPGQGEPPVFATAAATLWTLGVPVRLPSAEDAGRVPLPVYPFERERHWVDPDPETAVVAKRGPRGLAEWFAVPAWRQAVATAPTTQLGRVLLFGDGPRADALAAGLDAVRVRIGESFAQSEDGFTVRPGERADHDALVEALGADLPGHLVHAFALDGDPAGEDAAAVWAAQERGFHSVLALVQALAGRAGRLDVVCSGIGDVRGDDLLRPEHATLHGLVRVLPAELPDLDVRLIDADTDLALLDELRRPVTDREVTLRGARRWVLGFEDVTLADEAATAVREGGRYVITGGLGGIGISLAEDLAVRAKAKLVLTARGGLPPRAEWDTHLAVHGDGPTSRVGRSIAAIRRMEAAGAEVLVVPADVTDVAGLRRVRDAAVAAFGGVDGLVHAAGVAGGGVAEVKDRAAAERVLAPKLTGTLALSEVFGDDELDFVVLCSSVTSVLGGFGQVDYCAANAFLDAHARSGRGWRGPVLSQNWGGWAELGMAVETAAFAQSGAVTVESTVDHPVLRTLAVTGDSAVVHGIVTPDTHWLLDEHRIGGTAVVPGTAHLECVRAAFAAAVPGAGCVELRDVAFLEPFAVPDGDAARYEVVLTISGAEAEFVVQGRRGGVVSKHVAGTAGWTESDVEKVDLSAVVARTEPRDATTGFGTGRTSMLAFGPRWASLREHRAAADEELATIVAPEAARGDDWVLHPALLDVATAFGAGRGSGTYLPMSYGRVLVRDRLPERFHSHLRYRPADGDEVVVADLSLVDDDGRELVAVSEFLLRRVDQGAVTGGLSTAPERAARRRDPAAGDIAPADGVAAFHRSLAAGLGPQVVITPVSVAELAARADAPADVEPEAASAVAGDAAAGPRTELEAVIVRAWRDSLGVAAVGVHDDFFALGGNSLVAVQLIAALRTATGVRLPMRSLFEIPTVAGLAERIEELRAEAEPEPEPAAQTIRRLPRA